MRHAQVAFEGSDGGDKAQRFRAAALPYLNDVYTLARYLLRDPADAEDAAQECYLRAFRHFETFRGGPIKPWLLAILRNVCRAEYARRGALAAMKARASTQRKNAPRASGARRRARRNRNVLGRLDGETVRRLIAELPDQFRETIVLREINELSYREIADVVGVPVGTVMSRLARGRALLRAAWIAEEKGP